MRKLLTQTIAAVAIALFWCISAAGTTIAGAVGAVDGAGIGGDLSPSACNSSFAWS
jgi:hypothetical protein